VSNKALVTKVYFPRVLLPLAGVFVPLVDFLVASVVLVGMMFWFTVWPSLALVLAPLFLLMALLTALGVGLFLSAVNVRYRDVPYAIPFLVQIWMYVSGVVYAISALPERWQWLL
jgi:lipopolysaccharide transport system permease protein